MECQSKSIGAVGARFFVLVRTDNRPVLKGYRTLECETDNREDAERWVQAFTSVGIFRDIKGSMADLLANGIDQASSNQQKRTSIRDLRKISSVDLLEDSHIKDESRRMQKMIENYIKIVNMTIRDVTPKYIMLTLGKIFQIFEY